MQRLVRRMGLPFVIVAALTLLAVSAASLVLAVGYRDQLGNLKSVIHTRCVQRDSYDRASQQARESQRTYYRHLLANLRAHPSPQASRFNAQLERDAKAVIAGLEKALRIGAPQGCSAFK